MSNYSIWLRLAAVALCLCSNFPLDAQYENVRFQRLNLEDGLSQGTIHCMLQDQKGFMWFGTQDGLNKYDGYKFTVFRYDRQDSASISDNWINCLYEGRDGYLWIGTLSGGLNRFDRATESFINYQHAESVSGSLPDDNIRYILEDHLGLLWVGTDQGLARKDGDLFFEYSLKAPGGEQITINYLYEGAQNELWVGTSSGLFLYNRPKDNFERVNISSESLNKTDVKSILNFSKEEVLLGTIDGLILIKYPDVYRKITFPEIRENKVNAVAKDSLNNYWIGYDGEGIVRWNPSEKNHKSFRYQPAQTGSLSNDLIHDILIGKFGNIWVGTLNGISRYNIGNVKFRLYQNVPGVIGHTSNSVFSITKDLNGHLWTATREGIFRTNSQTGAIDKFDSNSKPALNDDAFRTVFNDRDGNIWIGSANGRLSKLNPRTMKVRTVPLSSSNVPNPIFCIYEDPSGVFWIGAKQGLYRLNDQDKSSRHYPLDEIRSINQDKSGLLWIGTLGAGVYKFHPQTEAFQQYRHQNNNPNSLSHDIVASIHIDAFDTLWIGTASGFNKYHPDQDIFHHYNLREGLPGEVVYGILPGNGDHFWLSTNNGLTRFDRQHKTFRTYHSSDGLQGSEFNAGAYFKSSGGELYFGGLNGVNAFFPAEIRDHPLLPEVILTGFKVLNEDRVMEKSLEYVDKIDLSYKDYFFSFEFTALHLAAPERNRYAYKMVGFDRDWVYSERRFANYTNLDPGHYTFMVKASNNDGVWNDKELAIAINIAPPFWMTWWFYLASLLLIIGVIYGIYRLRVGQIRKEEELKTEFNRKLSEVEMIALRSQMNPHFLFNCLNSINRYIVKSDPETASGYLTKFSRLIRLILHNSKSPTIPLSNELEALRLYIEMEDLRFENKFDYCIDVDPAIEADYLEVPPMMIQPYVENAIWHGLMHKEQKGKLLVSLVKQGNTLRCVIEDNGIGRVKARELKTKSATRNKSMGMKITRDRLSLIHKFQEKESMVRVEDLKDAEGNAIGTRVTLYIPIEAESWEPSVDPLKLK